VLSVVTHHGIKVADNDLIIDFVDKDSKEKLYFVGLVQVTIEWQVSDLRSYVLV
jgi:hypothetical protein